MQCSCVVKESDARQAVSGSDECKSTVQWCLVNQQGTETDVKAVSEKLKITASKQDNVTTDVKGSIKDRSSFCKKRWGS